MGSTFKKGSEKGSQKRLVEGGFQPRTLTQRFHPLLVSTKVTFRVASL